MCKSPSTWATGRLVAGGGEIKSGPFCLSLDCHRATLKCAWTATDWCQLLEKNAPVAWNVNAFFKSPRSLAAPKNVTAASRLHRSTVAFCRKTGFIVSVQPHKDCVSPLNAHVSFCVKLRQQFQFRRNLFFFIYTAMFYVYLYIVNIQNTSSFFFVASWWWQVLSGGL